jgi:large subunit ribosomal protein L6
MKRTVTIPQGVKVELDGMKVKVSGKATLEKDFASPLFAEQIKLVKEGDTVVIESVNAKRKIKSELGCIEAHIKNMIEGAGKEWEYQLKIVFMHFPFTVKVEKGEIVVVNFLGEKAPRKAEIIGNTKVEVKGDLITVRGHDKEHAGQTAANIERATRVSSRDRRIYQDGCFIIKKA